MTSETFVGYLEELTEDFVLQVSGDDLIVMNCLLFSYLMLLKERSHYPLTKR